jgi:hypothetical protein
LKEKDIDMKKKVDPYTGETFIPKRTNQRFANRDNQIAFNNAKAKRERDRQGKIDNQIRRNYQILDELLKTDEIVQKTREYLLGKGYNFNFMNNKRAYNGQSYFGVYDCGIRAIGNNIFEIVKFKQNEPVH